MKIIAILESELDQVSMLSALMTVAFTCSGTFLSLAVGIWVTAAFADTLTAEGTVLSGFVAWVLFGMAIVAAGLGGWARLDRGSKWRQIKQAAAAKAS